jgi:hypothetical protein
MFAKCPFFTGPKYLPRISLSGEGHYRSAGGPFVSGAADVRL